MSAPPSRTIPNPWGHRLPERAGGLLHLPVGHPAHSLSVPAAWIALGSEWGEHHVPVRSATGWQFDRYFSLSGVAITAVSTLWMQRYSVGYTSVIQPIPQYLAQRILLQRYPGAGRLSALVRPGAAGGPRLPGMREVPPRHRARPCHRDRPRDHRLLFERRDPPIG